MDIGDLTEPRPLDVVWGKDRLGFTYDPGGYDEALHVQFSKAMALPDDDPSKIAINDAIIARMVPSWELTQAGIALPVTPDVIRQLPVLLRLKMAGAIMADVMAESAGPKEPRSEKPSTNGSSRTVDEAVALITGSSFEPREGWGTDSPG